MVDSIDIIQSIDRTCYLGGFVDGEAVMFKKIMSYLGECVAALWACVFLPGCVCWWWSSYVSKHNCFPG